MIYHVSYKPLVTFILFVFCFSLSVTSATAQQQKNRTVVSVNDYRRAEQMLGRDFYGKIQGTVEAAHWSPNGTLSYITRTADGFRFMMADAAAGTKAEAFNHPKMAQLLKEELSRPINANRLPIRQLEAVDAQTIRFKIGGTIYQVNVADYTLRTIANPKKPDIAYHEVKSPDETKVAYIKDYNLWMRNLKTGQETQLTTNGEEHYGYATNNAGWVRSERPVLKWSPGSDKIATIRHDSRGVGNMYLYNTTVGHSNLDKWKYPLPGDSTVFKIERVIIHTEGQPKVVPLQMEPDFHRSTSSDHIAGSGGMLLDTQWSPDGNQLAFVSVSRNHQNNKLRIADAQTGTVRGVMQEQVDTYFESGHSSESWRLLADANELLWFSERSNWGQLYLYDLETGMLKNQITEGHGRVLDVEYVDEANRVIYFTGAGGEGGHPYYQYLYRVNFDGTNRMRLTPEPKNHSISWGPDKKYFIDTYSTPTEPPVSVIRNTRGETVVELERADITPLKKAGWQSPKPFTTLARDGQTKLYGLMFTPSTFDSTRSYPVINYLYPGPQSGSIRGWDFRVVRGDHQALAELGFIVVAVNALGTPGRSKSFHDAWYGNMYDNGVPDQVATIRQLARRHSALDTTRVGIWGHSGGGYASTAAMLQYPDFYKVAVSESGNHDNRNYESDWGDKWQGLLKPSEEGQEYKSRYAQGDNYDRQANQLHVENLQGKLLLAHGLMDDNVPPTNTLLVADALIRANKDFDMFMIPNAGHGYGYAHYYFMNKRWDYFVEHLLGAKPPADFQFQGQ